MELWIATLALFAALVVGVAAIALNRAAVTPRPRKVNPPFAGGLAPRGEAWVRFRPRYAILALLFIAFDMEMVFMYPWAVAFKHVGITAFLDMLVFIAVLSAALAFAWKEGAFDWER